MKNVLAITMAIIISAIVLMPALGYTGETGAVPSYSITSTGNQSYTAASAGTQSYTAASAGGQSYTATSTGNLSHTLGSAGRPGYSFMTGVAAHNLTSDMVKTVNSVNTTSVQGMRMPYSIKYGAASNYSIKQGSIVPYSIKQGSIALYSIKLMDVNNTMRDSYQTVKLEPRKLGSVAGRETVALAAEIPTVAVAETPVVQEIAPNETVTLNETVALNETFVFSWMKVPGADDDRLKKYLGTRYNIDWIYTAGIVKSQDGKTINISQENKTLSLALNDEESEVLLKIDNITIDKFIAKMENGELGIFKETVTMNESAAAIEAAPVETVMTEAVAGGAVTAAAATVEPAPVEVATETAPVEVVTETAPVEAATAEVAPTEVVAAELTSVEEIAAEVAPIEAAATEAVPIEAATTEVAPVEATALNETFVFSWAKVPGADDDRLKGYLGTRYNLDWIYTAGIVKSQDNKTINISQEDKILSLALNDDESEVLLKINNNTTDKFIAKMENGELNIYNESVALNETAAAIEAVPVEAVMTEAVAGGAVAATTEPAPTEVVTEAAPVVEAAPVAAATSAAATATTGRVYTIEGVVFEDLNGNGVKNVIENGLANWTVNLEQPEGVVVKSVSSAADGKFVFLNQLPGTYTIKEVLQPGWTLVAPAEGKLTVEVINESVTHLGFANKLS